MVIYHLELMFFSFSELGFYSFVICLRVEGKQTEKKKVTLIHYPIIMVEGLAKSYVTGILDGVRSE